MSEIKLKLLTLGSMGTNGYVVYRDKEGVVIDPGDDFYKIDSFLKEGNITLKGILLTHGHFDHIGAAMDLKRAYGVKVYALEQERDTLEDPEKNLSAAFGEGYGITADEWLFDGETKNLAGIDFKVLHTPGHTPGGASFYIEEKGWLFSGDTLFHCSVGRSDFPGGSGKVLIQSIKEKLLCLPDDTKVFPGHMDPSVISVEKEHNPFIQESGI